MMEWLFTTEMMPDRKLNALCEGLYEGERIDRCSLPESSQKVDEHHEHFFDKFERNLVSRGLLTPVS
jgi:hypothetical protein